VGTTHAWCGDGFCFELIAPRALGGVTASKRDVRLGFLRNMLYCMLSVLGECISARHSTAGTILPPAQETSHGVMIGRSVAVDARVFAVFIDMEGK
jgi:hypothetical protein